MKPFENGRSMIEMLGVLAIIGVLSVGGLSGYTMAMNRHRANQIADYASRLAMEVQTQQEFKALSGKKQPIQGGSCKEYLTEDAPAWASGECSIYTYAGIDQITVKMTVPNSAIQSAVIARSGPDFCVNNGTTGTTREAAGNLAIDFNCAACPCKVSNSSSN